MRLTNLPMRLPWSTPRGALIRLPFHRPTAPAAGVECPTDAPSFEQRLPLRLEATQCCLCRHEVADPIAVGEDFEYRSSPDTFLALRCAECGLVYLNPRPAMSELGKIYPPEYHAYDFSVRRFGLVYRARRRLEARRVLAWCHGLGSDARILDVGCGDGFHLQILRDFGHPTWELEGVEPDARAAAVARRAGLDVHQGTIQDLELPVSHYDVALLIATLEHVDDPVAVLTSVRSLVRPGGKICIVTDNVATVDFRMFGRRHWGGYHFPRHWNLFDRHTLRVLAERSGLQVEKITTAISPVNWVYSVRNLLTDWGAPRWVIDRFGLGAAGTLAVFTLVDALNQVFRRGALLRATFRRPA
jgi:SAM-dependent methyltransferase